MRPTKEELKKPHIAQAAVALAQRIVAQAGGEMPTETEKKQIRRAALIIGIRSLLEDGAKFPVETAAGPLEALEATYEGLLRIPQKRNIPFIVSTDR